MEITVRKDQDTALLEMFWFFYQLSKCKFEFQNEHASTCTSSVFCLETHGMQVKKQKNTMVRHRTVLC